MDATTLIVAAVGSVLAIALSPIRALCVYLCVLLLHAQELGVSLGVIDFSSARIVVFALTANVLFRGTHLLKAFRWNLLDTFVVLYFIGQLISLFNTEPFMVVLENRSGRLTDTVLPYFLCRAILRSKRDLIMVIKTLILVSLPLAFFGVVESARGWNYLQGLPAAYRDGHFRARGTFSVHIGFGLFFAAVVPLCIGLWHQRVWSRGFLVFCVCCCMAGLISTWSSGPILAMYFAIMFLCCYPIRRMWPLLLVAGFAMIVLVDNLSNRRWYEVPTRFLLSSSTAYYRIGLYKEAFGGGMTDHWLFGWGLVSLYSPREEFPWNHNDLTSVYIAVLVQYGLHALLLFLLVLFAFYHSIRKAYLNQSSEADRWFVWCMAAASVGWHMALLSVNTVSQILTLIYVFFSFPTSLALPGVILRKFRASFSSNDSNERAKTCTK